MALWLFLALALAVALAWAALHWFIVPRIDDLRPRLQALASQALGAQVTVDRIEAVSNGLIPVITLHDLRVQGHRQTQAGLHVPRAQAAFSVRSLLRKGLESLEIEGAQVQVRRRADGRLLVAGLDVSGDASADTQAADWLFSQPLLLLQGGRLLWVDEMRPQAAPLALSDLRLALRNSRHRHFIELQATPEPQWGDRFSLQGEFRQPLLSTHAGQWQQWSGQAQAEFPRVDVARLHQYADAGDLGVELRQGHGRLSARLQVRAPGLARARQASLELEVNLADVAAVLAPDHPALELRALTGRLQGQMGPDGLNLRTQDLQWTDATGRVWPGGNVQLTLHEKKGQEGGRLEADTLDLAALARLAQALPLPAAARQALTAHPPGGRVETIAATWQGPLQAVRDWQVQIRAVDLAVGADEQSGAPGVDGLALTVRADARGGEADVRIAAGGLSFPGVFEQPRIALDSLTAQARWSVQPDGQIRVTVPDLRLQNADASGAFAVHWRTGDAAAGQPRFPGVLDLSGRFAQARGDRVHRYLPLVIPQEARHYVRDAIREGQASNFDVAVQGDLRHVPFDAPGQDGVFRFAGVVKNVRMAYVPDSIRPADQPPWPALQSLSGRLVFEGNSMRVEDASAQVQGHPGWRFGPIDVRINDMAEPRVLVKTRGQGALAAALGIAKTSPVAIWTQHALDDTRAEGQAQLELALDLPVFQLEQSRVSGAVTLAGNTIAFSPGAPVLAQAQGRIDFDENGFRLRDDVQAQALGGAVQISGGSAPARKNATEKAPALVQIKASGSASAQGLQAMRQWGPVPGLARLASGSARYEAVLNFRHGEPDITVQSALRGLAFDLPAPLHKAADEDWPLHYERRVHADGSQRQRVSVADRLRAEYESPAPTSAAAARGLLALGAASVAQAGELPASGISAQALLPQLRLDDWKAALQTFTEAEAETGAEAQSARPSSAPAAAAATSAELLPTHMQLETDELHIGARTLHAVQIHAQRQGGRWSARVQAREMQGQVNYRQAAGGDQGTLHARLSRLHWPRPQENPAPDDSAREPLSSIPALDVRIDDFQLHGLALGQLQLDAVNHAPSLAGQGQWQLRDLRLQNPDATLQASGSWQPPAPGAARRTTLDFELQASNAGALLARMGMPDTLKGGQGSISGALHWTGDPATPHYASMGGHLKLDMGAGQFLKAEPGAAKLLGVLSLQALPRRLTLDFRDMFSAGFAFDKANADVSVAAGIATTSNLRIRSASAAVLMQGSADLARETQDLTVLVMPEIDAGNAALATAFINPAAGAVAFIAQLALRKPLSRAAMRELRITGSWSDPQVTPVKRSSAAEAGKQADQKADPKASAPTPAAGD